MKDAIQDLVVYACVLGAAARVHLSSTRWMARMGTESIALGALLGTAYVGGAAMVEAWRGTSENEASWQGVFVALAGLLGGFRAMLTCVGVLGLAALLTTVPALHAFHVHTSGWQLLVAASAGVLGRLLLANASGWLRYVVISLLGGGLALYPWLLVEERPVALTVSRAALLLCCAVGLCLGYRAFTGLRVPSRARNDSEQENSFHHAFAQHALVLENAIEGIAFLAVDGTVVQTNPALGELAGISHDALVGRSWLDLAPSSERAALSEAFRVAHAEGRAVVECVLRDGEASSPVEFTLVRDAADSGKAAGLHLLARDLRERRATARFEHLALHDQLTGLPNRRALIDRLEDSLKASPGRPAKVAVLLFDIDKFKYINDAFGHAAGDTVLKHAASQMSRAVRPTDTLARLGGDEFVLIARGIDSLADAESLAERFRTEAACPLRIGGSDVSIHLSVGIALTGASKDSADTILDAADRAMYENKARSHAPSSTGVHVLETKPLFGKARARARGPGGMAE